MNTTRMDTHRTPIMLLNQLLKNGVLTQRLQGSMIFYCAHGEATSLLIFSLMSSISNLSYILFMSQTQGQVHFRPPPSHS